MNDYTKNISTAIFSPSLTTKNNKNKFTIDHKKVNGGVSSKKEASQH